MNRQLKQTACVWKSSLVTDIRHDRLHDRQPATWGHAPGGKEAPRGASGAEASAHAAHVARIKCSTKEGGCASAVA